VKFDIEGFPLCRCMIGPCEFVIEMNSEEKSMSLLGVMVGGGQGLIHMEKDTCADLFGFILILHKLNQF